MNTKQDLKGMSFNYTYNNEIYKFTITRDWYSAIRVRINDSIQAIWIPKQYVQIEGGVIKVKPCTLNWKLSRKEFQHKAHLSRGAA